MGNDGVLWSSWTDGTVHNVTSNSGGDGATTGFAILDGYPADGSLRVRVQPQRRSPSVSVHSAAPLYPCASFSYNGVYYQGTYALDDGSHIPQTGYQSICHGNTWCVGGPFVGFHISYDGGRSWDAGVHPRTGAVLNASHNALAQPWPSPPHRFHFRVMQPHFVDHGPNNVHTPEPGYAYLVSQGCDTSGAAANSSSVCGWVMADQIYLLRLRLSPATANLASAYEYYAGRGGDGSPTWSASLDHAQPIIQWPGRVGVTHVVWVAGQRRYVMFVSCPSSGGHGRGTFDSWVAEAHELTGPCPLSALDPSASGWPSRCLPLDGWPAAHPEIRRVESPPQGGWSSTCMRLGRKVSGG
jgi:hypothetical protein